VYVSVLALRGRLREVPWYSFFTWGFKAPREWWTAFWYEGRSLWPPRALVDLSKPAFRLGLAEIRVGTKATRLNVSVNADKRKLPGARQGQVTITGKLPNGQPAANAEVALAAVDQALLELMPNTSWNLLDAMLQRRSLGRGDLHRADGNHRPAPLRTQGRASRRRRRPQPHARAAGHPAAVEPGKVVLDAKGQAG
jgi:hypothetical protein